MTNVNSFYASYATCFMLIDMTEDGQLFCQVPSESNGESYTVQVDESGVCPTVTSCTCLGFKYRKSCKHCTIVQGYWDKMYKTNIQKASEKALEAAMNEAEAIDEAYELAEIADAIVAAPIVEVAPVVRKSGDKLVLTAQTCKIFIADKPRKPRKYATEYVAKQEHYGRVKSEMAEVRDRGVLNGTPRKDEMPAWLRILPSRQEKVGA